MILSYHVFMSCFYCSPMENRGNQKGGQAASKAGSASARSDTSKKSSSRSTADEKKSAKNEPKINEKLATKNEASKSKPIKTGSTKDNKVTTEKKSDKNVPTKKTDKDQVLTKTTSKKPASNSGKETPNGRPAADKAKVPPRAPPRGGARGRGGKRRKPKISPEERRRRELKKWLSVQAYILGLRIALTPPERPFFIQRERELLTERHAEQRERDVADAAEGALKARSKAHMEHDTTVRLRCSKQRASQQRRALKADQQLEQRFADLEQQRYLRQRAQQKKVYEQRMREIKLAEERKQAEKLRRQDEERVLRILKNII